METRKVHKVFLCGIIAKILDVRRQLEHENESGLTLPASSSGSEKERRLLIEEAKEFVKESRAEHQNRITKLRFERM